MPRRSAFAPALLLALIFVACKAASVWPLTPRPTPSDLLMICAEDLAAALAFGLVAAIALRLSARRPALHRLAWRSTLTIGVIAALYAVVNVGVYRHLRQPLNLRLLSLVGNPADLSSSLKAHSDPGVLAGAALAPLAFGLIVGRKRRALRFGRWAKLAIVAVALTWIACGAALLARTPPDAWQRRAGRNPHRAMLASLFSRRGGAGVLGTLDETYPSEYLADFRLAGQLPPPPPLPQFIPPPKNVILIVLESTSAQYLSLYGSPYATTPTLLAESRNALVFDRFYAHIGYTFCSMMPLIEGVHPGLPWLYQPACPRPTPPGLASLLKSRGARTAFFSVADPDWFGIGSTVEGAGFDAVYGPREMHGPQASSWGTEDGVGVTALLDWIAAGPSDQPFFAMLWTDQTHDPYTLEQGAQPTAFVDPRAFSKAPDLNRYLSAIRQADRHLARLFDALRRRGLADDTLVVITGDHGEAFGDLHPDNLSHGSSLFDESLRVPLILWNPRLFPQGRRITDRVGGHQDVLPTIAHLLNITPPSDWQGASLLGPDHPGRVYLQADRISRQFGLTDGRWKYMLFAEGKYECLYDLQADPQERLDVSSDHPALVAEFRSRVSAQLRTEEAYMNAKPLAAPVAR
jgi:arylsulfatase A-like enzyme